MKQVVHLIAFLILSVLLVACSGPSEVRKAAGALALSTSQVQGNLESFAKTQFEVDRLRHTIMTRLQRRVREAGLEGESHLHYWRMAKDKGRISLLTGVLEGTRLAEEHAEKLRALDAEQRALLSGMEAAVDTRSAMLSDVAKALNALSDQESAPDRARFLMGFVQKVKESYEEARREGEDEMRAAAAARAAQAEMGG